MKDYVGFAWGYQEDVVAGRIPACLWVKLACQRNIKDLQRQDTEEFPYRFDHEKAVRICQMAEMLPHVKGPHASVVGRDEQGRNIWNPICLEPWQCWILVNIFGWVDGNGLRRFRTALTLVPRKNAKSTLAAIVMLFMLVADGEMGAEIYSAATTRDQAKVIAEIAWEMANRSPAFREYYGVRMGAKTSYTLSVPVTASKFSPLSADAHTLDGLNISAAAIDEFHAHKTRGVYDVIDTATGARLQSLLFLITTAGVELGGICHEKVQYLQKLLDGSAVDETFFGVNYTVDAEDDWKDPDVHRKANPNYGVSVQPDDLIRKATAAQVSHGAINNFLTKHLNIWVRSESGWMLHDTWQACTQPGLMWESLKQYPCWIGVDLGEVRDFSALVLVFLTAPDTYVVIPQIYVPEAALEQSPIAQLPGWVRDAHITKTPGTEADYGRIEMDLLQFCKDLPKLREIDFDQHSARLMMQKIREALEPKMGRDRVEAFVLGIPQTVATMDPAMKVAERLVTAKKLTHTGNPAMAWMVSNIVIERNHKDEIYPRKAGGKDSHNKIDGPIAMFTALSRAMQSKEPTEPQMFFFGGKR